MKLTFHYIWYSVIGRWLLRSVGPGHERWLVEPGEGPAHRELKKRLYKGSWETLWTTRRIIFVSSGRIQLITCTPDGKFPPKGEGGATCLEYHDVAPAWHILRKEWGDGEFHRNSRRRRGTQTDTGSNLSMNPCFLDLEKGYCIQKMVNTCVEKMIPQAAEFSHIEGAIIPFCGLGKDMIRYFRPGRGDLMLI